MSAVENQEVEFEGEKVGEITHFFDNISVAVVKPTKEMKVDDEILIYDRQGNIVVEQTVDSMEIDGEKIDVAEVDQEFGMKVEGDVKEGYEVYRK
jgi:hypothetical protein